MSAAAIPASPPVGVEEYLGDPAYARCEYVDGRVEPLNVGSKTHGRIQSLASKYFVDYFLENPIGYVGSELHCRLKIGGRERYRLPDLAVVIGDESPDEPYLHRAPDLAVEIRSPEDPLSALLDKAREYLQTGARQVWIVVPEEEAVWTLDAEGRVRVFRKGEILDAGDVLPGFGLAVDDLYR